MREAPFYKLPRNVQERFLGAVAGRLAPAPLFRAPFVEKVPAVWLGSSAAAVVVLLLLLFVGHGNLDSPFSHHPVAVLAVYVGALFTTIFGVTQVLAIKQRARLVPFARGVYVFPLSIIDARSTKLRVHSMEEATAIDGPSGATGIVRFTFEGHAPFVFEAGDPVRGQEALTTLELARQRAPQARANNDANTLAELDPLFEPKFSSPVGPGKPMEEKTPPVARFGWMAALAFGVVAGTLCWLVRNATSDDAMYASAKARGDSAAFRAYLRRGSRHQEEVAEVLLPTAELKDAVRLGSVKAVQAFIENHLHSRIQRDVDAALRSAMLAELGVAQKAGTLAALDDFVAAHPDHNLPSELKEARHAVYRAALDQYKQRAPDKDRGAVAFFERLLAFAEKSGPRVEVRVRRNGSTTLAKADSQLTRNPNFMGAASFPSRYFDDGHVRPREQRMAQAVVTKLQDLFAKEILAFDVGPSLTDPDAPLPVFNVPTVLLEHGVEWSGFELKLKSPKGVYVGLKFPFEATFRIPGDARLLAYKHEVQRGVPVDVVKDDPDSVPGHVPAGSPEEKLYDAYATDAADHFLKKYFATFVKG